MNPGWGRSDFETFSNYGSASNYLYDDPPSSFFESAATTLDDVFNRATRALREFFDVYWQKFLAERQRRSAWREWLSGLAPVAPLVMSGRDMPEKCHVGEWVFRKPRRNTDLIGCLNFARRD